ncbi:hypothetical protein GCM10009624_12950 [Gordonia sinesedis]
MAEAATVGGASLPRGSGVGTASPATDNPRGALVIDNRVGEKIAARAALDVDGVVPYASTITSLLGGAARSGHSVDGDDYPRARVDMSQAAPTVSVSVALRWPSPVTAVSQQVRRHVADELARLTGQRPLWVDVTVAQLVPGSIGTSPGGADRTGTSTSDGPTTTRSSGKRSKRRGFTELPASAQGAGDETPSAGDDSAEQSSGSRVSGRDMFSKTRTTAASQADATTDDSKAGAS